MDVSIIAAVGSFIVSERVIKAKATALLGLLCVVCYDLSIHSNDPVSLRVYRGPALLAISFVCGAFCLRSWRRNGVACDEIIFLPGSLHAQKSDNTPTTIENLPLNLRNVNTGDNNQPISQDGRLNVGLKRSSSDIDSVHSTPTHGDMPINEKSLSLQSPDSEDVESTSDVDDALAEMAPLTNPDVKVIEVKNRLWHRVTGVCRRPKSLKSTTQSSPMVSTLRVNKFSTQFVIDATRYFSSTTESNEYAPSGPSVAGGALDLFLPVLFNFHLFIMATNYEPNSDNDTADNDQTSVGMQTTIPPQVLPLIFLTVLSFRSILPRKSRKRFWSTIYYAVMSPFQQVTLRDAFIAETLTSMVRPMQDICFAIFYYFAAVYGIFFGSLELEDIGKSLSHNLLLHNIVLPTCAVIPLVVRFLQTLREAFDDQRRWPHLGNSFKYLSASLVILYGMTHSEEKRSIWWTLSYVFCVIYQTLWDFLMDWEILTFYRKETDLSFPYCLSIFQYRIKLRSERLFKSNTMYWRMIIFNTLFRFTWMFNFIPAYHVNAHTGKIENTFSTDLRSVAGFSISVTELIRRCIWGMLRLEVETIKMTNPEYAKQGSLFFKSSRIKYSCLMPKDLVRYETTETSISSPVKMATSSQAVSMKWAAYRRMVTRIFCLEVMLWVGLYVSLGLWVSALI